MRSALRGPLIQCQTKCERSFSISPHLSAYGLLNPETEILIGRSPTPCSNFDIPPLPDTRYSLYKAGPFQIPVCGAFLKALSASSAASGLESLKGRDLRRLLAFFKSTSRAALAGVAKASPIHRMCGFATSATTGIQSFMCGRCCAVAKASGVQVTAVCHGW